MFLQSESEQKIMMMNKNKTDSELVEEVENLELALHKIRTIAGQHLAANREAMIAAENSIFELRTKVERREYELDLAGGALQAALETLGDDDRPSICDAIHEIKTKRKHLRTLANVVTKYHDMSLKNDPNYRDTLSNALRVWSNTVTEDKGDTDGLQRRVCITLGLIVRYGGIEGDHHRVWVLDQVTRALTGDYYERFVAAACDGEDGPNTYDWDTGTAP